MVAASAVYWGLLFSARPVPAPSFTLPVAMGGVPAQVDLTRVLGREAEVPVVASDAPAPGPARFQLLGVVAPKAAGQASGWALIGIDGKPAKAYRQGAVVEGDVVLQAVSHRSATLGPRGQSPQFQLEIPPLAAAARGIPAGMTPPPAAPSLAVPGRVGLPGSAGAAVLPGGGLPAARPLRPVEPMAAAPAVPALPTREAVEAQALPPTPAPPAPGVPSGPPLR